MDPPTPDTLSESEQLQLKAVRTHCPELDVLTRHVRSFAVMLTERQGERLPDWLDAVPFGRAGFTLLRKRVLMS
ncbi:hypothetical protein ABT174_18060 [Streptomyces sparsogenes]|uniref:hypothetical protein n=1 Tax=Streptomyces sparsogenes TaxID=67365 RepID=UPI00331B4A4A